jgi:hypothetical protein
MESAHISIASAVAFILDGIDLTPAQEAHLLSCEQCRHDVLEAAFEELKRRENNAA